MFEFKIPKISIPEIAFEIERASFKNHSGRQDIYAGGTGGFNLYNFGERISICPVENINLIRKKLFSRMALCWTGMQRDANKYLAQQSKKVEFNIDSYKTLKELAFEGFSILNKAERNFDSDFVNLIKKNRLIKYNLSSNIVPDKIKNMENNLLNYGVITTKLLGAGGGGFILCIFEEEFQKILIKYKLPYSFLPVELDLFGSELTLKV